MPFWRSGDNGNPVSEDTVDRSSAPPERPANGSDVLQGDVSPLVPFGPINFRDPEWWEKVPKDALPQEVDPDVEPRVLAALVLSKAQRGLWAARGQLATGEALGLPTTPTGSDGATEATRSDEEAGEGADARAEPPANLKAITPSGLADWVAFRFQFPLTDSVKRGKHHRRLLLSLGMGISGAGLAASLLAVLGGNGQWGVAGSGTVSVWALLAAAAGVLVGVLTAISQILKPAQRSVASYQLTHTLRHEGWDYVSGRGQYRGRTGPQALDLFIDEVNRIQRTVEAIDESTVEMAHESKPTSEAAPTG
jgi:hypothetical protein